MSAPGLEENDLAAFSNEGDLPLDQWPPASRRAAGCGAGCLAAVGVQGLLIWALSYLPFSLPEPEMSLDAPAQVVVGEKFPLTLTVKNRTAEVVTVTSILGSRETMSQLTLEAPDPAPRAPVPGFEARGGVTDEPQIWTFAREIPPGKSFTVRFTASARGAGTLKGNIHVQAPLVASLVPFKIEARMPDRKPKANQDLAPKPPPSEAH